MRVAAIYDIHANLPALEAALDEIHRENVDLVVVGGDVLPGPMPRESLACLTRLDIPSRFIIGNGDREVLAIMDGRETEWFRNAKEEWRVPMRWTAGQLGDEERRILSSWPATCRVEVDGLGEVLFCHATPRSDSEYFTRETPADLLTPIFANIDLGVVICGHTHMQFDRMIAGVRVVNAGSVGMAYGRPGACWLLLGPDVEHRRTLYDFDDGAVRIRETSYPGADNFVARTMVAPPSEKEMIALYERHALG